MNDRIALAKSRYDLRAIFESWGSKGPQVRCPSAAHEDRVASARLYEREQKWYCFGCGMSGDVVDAYAARFGLDISQALDHLLGDNVTPPTRIPPEAPRSVQDARETPRSYETPPRTEEFARYAHEQLLTAPNSGYARSYLRDRGYDRATIDRWGIGHVHSALTASQYEGGHVRGSNLVLPLQSPGGVLEAVAAWDPGGRPKYRLPDGYSKGLYGFHLAARRIVEENVPELVVVEGFNDVHMVERDRFPVVGLFGGRLTDSHFPLLHLLAYRTSMRWLVLFMDGDEAGAKALKANIDAVRARLPWCGVMAVETPFGTDPGELYAAGPWREMADFLRGVRDPAKRVPKP